ncbi:MAG: polymorphic toxin type 17 domain-containing protein [Gemmataceae bacterium]
MANKVSVAIASARGAHPFVPPKRGDWLRNPPRGPQGGYVDANGNEWVPHPSPSGREEDFHWDV